MDDARTRYDATPAMIDTASDDTPTHRRKRLRWYHLLARGILALLFLVGAFFGLVPQGRAAARTTLLVPALVLPKQRGPLALVAEPVRHSTLTVSSRSGPVYLDVYEPAGPPPVVPGAREGVLVIPGVGDERKDSQLINLSMSLAEEGLVVMDMTTPALIAKTLTPLDGDAVTQAFLALLRHPGVGSDRAGILGISGGGSLACFAVVDPRIQRSVSYLMLFGGYYDATTLLRDFGRRSLSVDGRLVPWQPNPVPVQVLANTIATTLPPGEGNVLVRSLSPGGKPLTPGELARLSPGAAAAYHLLAGDQPDRVDANLAALSPQMRQELVALSPSSVAASIRAPVYLLHDQNDQYVPFTESREFAAALTRNGQPHDFVELTIFAHVEVKSQLGLGPVLTDSSSLFRILSELLLKAS